MGYSPAPMFSLTIRPLAPAVALALWLAVPAQADTHGASPLGGGTKGRSSSSDTHAATPLRTPSASRASTSSSVRYRSWRPYRYNTYYRPLWWAPAPVVMVGATPGTVVQSAPAEPAHSDTHLGVSAQLLAVQGRLGFGADLVLEGRELGLFLEIAALPVGTTEAALLADASIGFTVLGGEAGRVRVEVGALTAVMPGMAAAAPGVGVSGALAVLGPVLLTGRVRGAVWPYLRAEAQAAAVLALGPVGLQGGFRAVHVQDLFGLASGANHTFTGPFVGLELVL